MTERIMTFNMWWASRIEYSQCCHHFYCFKLLWMQDVFFIAESLQGFCVCVCVCVCVRRPVYFYALGVKCTLWRPFLRFYAWGARFYAFWRQSSTIDLCDKSYRLSSKTAAEWRIYERCVLVGCLLCEDPINVKLTRTLARTWIFSLATTFGECPSSVVEKSSLCDSSTMSIKRNREMGSCDDETGV